MSLLIFFREAGSPPAALDLVATPTQRWYASGGVYRQTSYQTRTDYGLRLWVAPEAQTNFSLTADGSQLTLTGGTAALDLALAGSGSALALTGGAAYGDLSLAGTGTQLTITGGVAFGNLSLAATGSALALSGGVAYGDISLAGTGSALALSGGTAYGDLALAGYGGALTLTGGDAAFQLGGDFDLTGTGTQLTIAGGVATFDLSLTGTGAALALAGGVADFVLDAVEAPQAEERPAGGWAAYNDAQIERRRRRRKELEEEADRLEALLIEEGTLPPNPALLDRVTVREYAPFAKDFSRRTQRAIDYALKARTDLAYQLAAREIARQVEEEELTMLLILAAA